MTNDFGTIIAKGLPILIIALLSKLCFNIWWQFIDPESFYANQTITICFPPPSYVVLIQALLVTGIIGMAASTIFGSRWGYQTIKWLLIIATPISLYIFWEFFTRLWDYGAEISTGNGQYKEITLTSKQKWTDIYVPILVTFGIATVVAIGLWFWTREMVKSKFKSTTYR